MGLDPAWRDTGCDEAFQSPREFHRSPQFRYPADGSRALARTAVAAMMAALVCGCAVGPDFAPPLPPDGAGYSAGPVPARTVAANVPGGEAQRLLTGRDIPGDWWRLFGSQRLRTLTERALKNNADLATAQAALRAAQANLSPAKPPHFPAIHPRFS